MPIKGILLIFIMVVIFAFIFRKEIYKWVKKEFKNKR